MDNIREEILNALPTPDSFLATNFRVPKKLMEKYGSDQFYNVLEEYEKLSHYVLSMKLTAHNASAFASNLFLSCSFMPD